ncbi:hypothetical protein [Streptomyces gossypii]|uniref:hypothetical protein n=1 Tax=Streptomyces gossypii TaxID=2883101 RepID=UPI0035CCF9FA
MQELRGVAGRKGRGHHRVEHAGEPPDLARHAGVDYRVLTRHLPGWEPAGVLDTLRLARATYTDTPDTTSTP